MWLWGNRQLGIRRCVRGTPRGSRGQEILDIFASGRKAIAHYLTINGNRTRCSLLSALSLCQGSDSHLSMPALGCAATGAARDALDIDAGDEHP
jgi:hypothetical protein